MRDFEQMGMRGGCMRSSDRRQTTGCHELIMGWEAQGDNC